MAVGDEVYFNAWTCGQAPIVPKVPHGAKPVLTPQRLTLLSLNETDSL